MVSAESPIGLKITKPNFSTLLGKYLDKCNKTPYQVARDSGLPIEKINEWLTGKDKPQHYNELLLIQTGLKLSETEIQHLSQAADLYKPL